MVFICLFSTLTFGKIGRERRTNELVALPSYHATHIDSTNRVYWAVVNRNKVTNYTQITEEAHDEHCLKTDAIIVKYALRKVREINLSW
jgi:hypothetical protein